MNAETLKSTLKKAVKTREPILIVSAPGCGKSEIVAAMAREEKFDLATFHPSVGEPTDIKGFPWCSQNPETGRTHAEFVTYGEMERILNPTRMTVAFFDDLGQATEQMQAALMQVLWARELNGKRISQNVAFVGATNNLNDKAGVHGFIEPLKSRWTSIVKYSPTVDDWIAWAFKSGMPDILIAFIKFAPQNLNAFKPSKTLENSPCPRTVASVGRILKGNFPTEAEYELIEGAAGSKFATDFNIYRPLFSQMPNIDDLIKNPEESQVEFDEPGIQIAVATALVRKTTHENAPAVIKYISRMPKEFGIMAMKDIMLTLPNAHKIKEYVDWTSSAFEFFKDM